MTYILPSVTQSTFDPYLIMPVTPQCDDGLFYVRWWTHGGTKPSEQRFDSRKNALAKSIEMQSIKSIARVECLECVEWSTRSYTRAAAV